MADNGGDENSPEIFPYPGGRKKSKVWETFGFLKKGPGPATKENLDMTKAVCRLCKKSYINKGNTTNFQFHIDHEHAAETVTKKSTTQAKPIQPKISQFSSQGNSLFVGRITEQRQSQIDDALLQLMVAKVLPLSLVDNQLFKNLVGLLDPRYSIPSRSTLVRSLEKKKDEIAGKLQSEIDQCESVSITHDGWTSMNTESYNTVTAHFINTEWVMKTAVLETKKLEGSHTSEKLAAALKETQTRWRLPEPIATTDNAANEKKAFEILEWPRFGCYGHRINLVVRKSLSVPEVSKILGKGRSLVTFFHSSSSISDELVAKQKLLLSADKVGHKLIMDVATRWNSTLAMLERLCEQTPAILALASDESISKVALTKIKNCAYNFEEQAIVERMVALLKPFEMATTILCAEKTPTMTKVLPTVLKLTHSVAVNAEEPPVIKAMKQKIASELELRTATEDLVLLACVLSPYMKDFTFMPDKRDIAHDMLRKLALGLNPSTVAVKKEKPDAETPPLPALPALPTIPDVVDEVKGDPETVPQPEIVPEPEEQPPPLKKLKSADTDEWLMDIVCIGETKQNIGNVVEQEVARYLGSVVKAGDESLTVLEWWKENECFYPRISRLAKKYLACQASSVSSERVFSLAGALVSKKRARMSPKNVDLLVFLNKNRSTYW